tara:strand:- start:197 stop:736 length:540 start_codon:yes stop_codon:yes gene_type:complete
MIYIIDNFLDKKSFNLINQEIKQMDFFDKDNDVNIANDADYPGVRTEDWSVKYPLIDNYVIRLLERSGSPFTQGSWVQNQYAYLKLAKDEKNEYKHTDPYDWAYLIYMSKTNLNSGTKFFATLDKEKKFKPLEGEIASASFVQNRLVMFNSNIVHRSWGDYGTNFANGRLTINGFCMRR